MQEILQIVFLSLAVSISAVIIATFIGLPFGILISLKEFKLKKLVITFLNTWIALPAVTIGLLVYIFLSRKGPFGIFRLLYTPYAIIIAQSILALPIVISLSISSIRNSGREIIETCVSLGATELQSIVAVIKEFRFGLVTAITTAFARVVGETGMTLMVGGNIKGFTRVMTTAIALETMKGNFEFAIILGAILVFIALIVNLFLQYLHGN